jgi:hypothetical protein
MYLPPFSSQKRAFSIDHPECNGQIGLRHFSPSHQMKVSGEAKLCPPTHPAGQPCVQGASGKDECNDAIEATG